jgi:hypothetical protein
LDRKAKTMSRIKNFKAWLHFYFGISLQQLATAIAALIPGGGGGSLTLEIPDGDIDGENDEFVFVGTPVAVMLNGVVLKPITEVTVVGHTATLVAPPEAGDVPDWVSGLVY